jgi:hypothetical protein
LHRISQRCGVQSPLMALRPPQPELKIGRPGKNRTESKAGSCLS